MKRGDIYLVTLDPTEGREQQGYRPVVVVSPDAFNQSTNLPVVLPITTGGAFAQRIGFAVPISGIKTTGVVRCDQPRVLDLAARHGRKIEALAPAVLDEVMAKVITIFE
ncbi:type II toxin-antitoxin system PemK/MazF family toxin [Candidatus Obscuribacterales bacterium]|nr:type II toxin-antitoxin system PemK/MazF family toxin [Candidatus Obscuribacterales bacterium]